MDCGRALLNLLTSNVVAAAGYSLVNQLYDGMLSGAITIKR